LTQRERQLEREYKQGEQEREKREREEHSEHGGVSPGRTAGSGNPGTLLVFGPLWRGQVADGRPKVTHFSETQRPRWGGSVLGLGRVDREEEWEGRVQVRDH